MKIRFVDDGRRVWRYSSMRVQYVAGSMIVTWMAMPEEYRAALIEATGITQQQAALGAAIVWLLANMFTRTTKVERT